MSILLDDLLVWLRIWAVPPIAGAAIGYVTNLFAIRMLFRPLEEKFFLGIRVPLTPGVIPRQRYKLARSIAKVVSGELLTPDAIRAHLQRPEFSKQLRQQLARLTAGLLSMSVRELTGVFQNMRPQIERTVTELLHRLVKSRGFIYGLRGIIERAVERAGSRSLSEVIDDLKLSSFVESHLMPGLAEPEVGRNITRAVRDVFERPQAMAGDLVSSEVTDRVVELLPDIIPSLMRELTGWLRRPAMRGELEMRGRFLLHNVLDRLNLMQKFFIGAVQYDRTLDERMPEIVDDVLNQLERSTDDPEVVKHMQEALREWFSSTQQRSLAGMLSDSSEGRIAEFWGAVVSGPITTLVGAVSQRFLEENGQKPIVELAARYLGVSPSETVDEISERLLNRLSEEETAQFLASEIATAVDQLGDQGNVTLGELLAVDGNAKEAWDGVIAERAEHLLVEQVPAMVAVLDVERLVIDRIDRLEVRDVERMLMIVIARHLKWINLFGGLIGFLIGLSQLVLRGGVAANGGL